MTWVTRKKKRSLKKVRLSKETKSDESGGVTRIECHGWLASGLQVACGESVLGCVLEEDTASIQIDNKVYRVQEQRICIW